MFVNGASSNSYSINKSLRFRGTAAGSYLNRTFTSVGNRKTWTLSLWFKRGTVTPGQGLLQRYTNGTTFALAGISNAANIIFYDYIAPDDYGFVTPAVLRDPSAWYHLVYVFDTTNATASDRMRVYVNGIRQSKGTDYGDPPLNFDGQINNNTAQDIGRYTDISGYADGYMADYYFIDGQALTPNSFGKTDSITGQWKPKKYRGTYGTTGFRLDFSNTTNTTTLCADSSGNGNNWTPNNISLTAGTTYDSMLDVPLGNNDRGNYCTLNPIGSSLPSVLTLSEGNLRVTTPAASPSSFYKAGASFAISTGKWYFESTIGAIDTNNLSISIAGTPPSQDATNQNGLLTGEVAYTGKAASFEQIYVNGSPTFVGAAAAAANDVIGVAFDADARTIQFYRNNSAVSTAQAINLASIYYISLIVRNNNTAAIQYANFGQRPFSYIPPAGYKSLHTGNLSTPSIKKPDNYFDIITRAGTSVAGAVSNLSLSPGFIWTKVRSRVESHVLSDIVRGTTRQIFSNLTNAEQTTSTWLTSFNNDGYSFAGQISGTGDTNAVGQTYVDWLWEAGTSTVANTAGTISSQVNVNTTSGFAIVSYTGTGVNATVGHGLAAEPKMIIIKDLSSSQNWPVYHAGLTNASFVTYLNLTNAQTSTPTMFNSTAPTSSVFSIGTNSNANNSAQSHIAYVWADVPGFSKFSSYIGNGDVNGTFVNCGFQPAYILIKRSDVADGWLVYDAVRSPYNIANLALQPNSTTAEYTETNNPIDIVSQGFKIRGTGSSTNTNAATYIYAAFAEYPFKYSNAR